MFHVTVTAAARGVSLRGTIDGTGDVVALADALAPLGWFVTVVPAEDAGNVTAIATPDPHTVLREADR